MRYDSLILSLMKKIKIKIKPHQQTKKTPTNQLKTTQKMGNRNREEEEKKNPLIQCFSSSLPCNIQMENKTDEGGFGSVYDIQVSQKKPIKSSPNIVSAASEYTLQSHNVGGT